MEQINISWMYPDILNLHGGRGDLMALERVAAMMGVKANIKRIENYNQSIEFNDADILFFTCGEVKSVGQIAERLKKEKEALQSYIDAGKIIFCIGTSGAAFGKNLIRQDGSSIECLGYFDMECVEMEGVYGGDLHIKPNCLLDEDVIGSQIQRVEFNLGEEGRAFGEVIYGKGNNEKRRADGAVAGNVFCTNLLGPALVKNPWLAEALLREALKVKGASLPEKLPKEVFDLEYKSFDSITKFIDKYSNMKIKSNI